MNEQDNNFFRILSKEGIPENILLSLSMIMHKEYTFDISKCSVREIRDILLKDLFLFDSINIIGLAGFIEKEFSINITDKEIFNACTLEQLAHLVWIKCIALLESVKQDVLK